MAKPLAFINFPARLAEFALGMYLATRKDVSIFKGQFTVGIILTISGILMASYQWGIIFSDTFIGIARLLGVNHLLREPLDFSMMEQIDLNGYKGIDKNNSTYQFMVGVGVLARKLNFPRITDEPQDVTDIVQQMLDTSIFSFTQYGKCSIDKSEADYKECRYSQQGNMGLWVVDATHDFNPSRPYEDGIYVVVVYRSHYKTISIYCDPDSSYEFAGQTIAGITFNGHAKACGSPRGQEMTLEDAIEVYSIL
jgi:hypothetical protein